MVRGSERVTCVNLAQTVSVPEDSTLKPNYSSRDFLYQNSILPGSVIVVDLKSHFGMIDSVSTEAKEFNEIEF